MEVDSINVFLENINEEELHNFFKSLKILICKKEEIGSQKLISICEQVNEIFYTIKVTEIKNFKKHKSSLYDYSFFGGIKKVLYSLIRDILVNTTPYDKKETYYLSYTFNRIYPSIDNAESITIDKTNIIEKYNNKSCIVCYEKYSDEKVEFKLKCTHSLCRECFLTIILRNDYKCPMCRQIMI